MKTVFSCFILALSLLAFSSCGNRSSSYHVIFVSDDSVYCEMSIPEGGTLKLPPEPQKDGYIFIGWYAGAVEWKEGDAVMRNVTLTARFIEASGVGSDENQPDNEGTDNEQGDVNDGDGENGDNESSGEGNNPDDNESSDDGDSDSPDSGGESGDNGGENSENHTHRAEVWITKTEATCTTDGLRYMKCEECGETFATEAIAKTGHSYEEIFVAPTCTESGYISYSCTACSDTYVERQLPPSGHSYRKTVVIPTCEAGGYTEYFCTVCSHSYKADYTEKTNHVLDEWYFLSEPSCTEAGVARRDCMLCDFFETALTDPSEHNYVGGICSECGNFSDAVLSYTLSDDGSSYTVSAAAVNDLTVIYIPDEYMGLPISAVGEEAFYENKAVKAVIFGRNVKTVGASAFENCTSLLYVDFGSVEHIGERAFMNCQSLEKIDIGTSVKVVDYMAFAFCSSASSIFIPASLRFIAAFAFLECCAVITADFEVAKNWYGYETADGEPCELFDVSDPISVALMLTSYAEGYSNLYWKRLY